MGVPVGAGAAGPALGGLVLRDSAGAPVPLGELVARQRFTVVVLYSRTCPCFAAHADRLRDVAAAFAPQGVRFLLVDSERHDDGEKPPADLGPLLPILVDPGAALARRLDARFATESFVLNREGQVRYRGGIDNERETLTPAARPYLRGALRSLLDGRAPELSRTKVLGCHLHLS
ncbi:MAG: redoxin domain-containing protein [Bacteroidota bacterium]